MLCALETVNQKVEESKKKKKKEEREKFTTKINLPHVADSERWKARGQTKPQRWNPQPNWEQASSC